MRRLILNPCIPALIALGSTPAHGQVNWQKGVYYDARYPVAWASSATTWVRDVLTGDGYTLLDADALKSWMDNRIADGLPSVVVFSQDIAPDTVIEVQSPACTLRRYLDAGGKIVWFADIPLYYQGHADGTSTIWFTGGSENVLGFNAAAGTWDRDDAVTSTAEGDDWGLTETWSSIRPALTGSRRVLARDPVAYAAAWVADFVAGDDHRGFVRFFDRPGTPNIDDLRRLAEYPNLPAPVLGENPNEFQDDIVCAFFYPWYGTPTTTGAWRHWPEGGHVPPSTWGANYLPAYPDGNWNPATQLYDSNDPQVLRWQDRTMARAGLDIAVSSWWGINAFSDRAFAQAIYTCKAVQWCIYYELDSVGDPTPAKIHSDVKYVLDTYTPYRNYAKIDDKWLVMIYAVRGDEPPARWRTAKSMLAADGYDVYFNADGDPSPAFAPDPWDAVHRYAPTQRRTLTESLASADDSHSISPGFWRWHQAPALVRDFAAFDAALDENVTERSRSRFMLVETWNEWHEGTSVEPGQEVVHDDVAGFSPSGNDYAHDYVDSVRPRAHGLRWRSSGHRPDTLPLRLEGERMVWEPGTSAEGNGEWRLSVDGSRIGTSLQTPDSATHVSIVLRARSIRSSPSASWPEMVLYWDQERAEIWTVDTAVSHTYGVIVSAAGGVHTLEVGIEKDAASPLASHLVVDYAVVGDASPSRVPAVAGRERTVLTLLVLAAGTIMLRRRSRHGLANT